MAQLTSTLRRSSGSLRQSRGSPSRCTCTRDGWSCRVTWPGGEELDGTGAMAQCTGATAGFPLFCVTLERYNGRLYRMVAPARRSIATVLRCNEGLRPSVATFERYNDGRGECNATRDVCLEAPDRARGVREAS